MWAIRRELEILNDLFSASLVYKLFSNGLDAGGLLGHPPIWTNEVLVHGNVLRRIETSMQRMELSFLAALLSSQRVLVIEGQLAVREISVVEAKDNASRTQDAPC